MKLTTVALLLLLTQQVFAQKIDTIWYNNKWEKTDQPSARHYARVIEKISSEKYLVKDYYETKSKQMEGIYSSMDPEIKHGEFNYWYRNGKKQMEVVFEANQAIQVCEYDEHGVITKEWERIAVTKIKNGKPVTEYRVLQRSPRFPGGKDAMNAFMLENIKYPVDQSEVKGQVIVQFKVNTDGKAVDPVIVTSLGPAFDKAALDVIKKMPKWEPGKQDDKLVEIKMSLPIKFN